MAADVAGQDLRGRVAGGAPSPQVGQPQVSGGGRFTQLLVQATQALLEEGLTEENLASLEGFAETLKQLMGQPSEQVAQQGVAGVGAQPIAPAPQGAPIPAAPSAIPS